VKTRSTLFSFFLFVLANNILRLLEKNVRFIFGEMFARERHCYQCRVSTSQPRESMHRNTITIRDPQHLLEENARLLIFIRTEVATKVGEGWM